MSRWSWHTHKERDDFERGERDASYGHHDYDRDRYSDRDRPYFDGYDGKQRRLDRQREEREVEEQEERRKEARRAEYRRRAEWEAEEERLREEWSEEQHEEPPAEPEPEEKSTCES